MNPFQKASSKERLYTDKLFKKLNIINFIFTDIKGYDRFDGTFEFNNKKVLFEVKCRNINSTDYNDTLLEKDKIDWLINNKIDNNLDKVLAIIHFNDKVSIIIDLERADLGEQKTKRCPDSTVKTKKYIDKIVYLIDITKTKGIKKIIW